MPKTSNQPFSRRAIKNDRLRQLFIDASEAGWTHKYEGGGHLRITAPDGRTSLSFSTTQVAARTALNAEAGFKRWLRMQNAMTAATGLPPVYRQPALEVEPMAETTTPTEVSEKISESLIVDGEETPDEDGTVEAPAGVFYCADGCGRVVSKEGGYARGHNPNSMANATKARAAKKPNGKGPSLFKTSPDQFTLDEVITIANYGGSGGLIEVTKLRDGLVMALRLRGER